MNLLRPEDNLSFFTQIVRTDRIDENIVKWINTDQGKQCKHNISNHADQFINRTGIFFYFSILFHVHILTSV